MFRFPEAIRHNPAIDACGKRMRHVKVKPGVDLDAGALDALIRAAYADIKRRLAAEQSVGIVLSRREQLLLRRDERDR